MRKNSLKTVETLYDLLQYDASLQNPFLNKNIRDLILRNIQTELEDNLVKLELNDFDCDDCPYVYEANEEAEEANHNERNDDVKEQSVQSIISELKESYENDVDLSKKDLKKAKNVWRFLNEVFSEA